MKELTFRSTTVLAVRRDGRTALAGDGQVSLQQTIVKSAARKVRRLYGDRVVCGFAGASADAFALLERFEAKLQEYSGNLHRSAVELAKEWRTDRALRRLEALMLVADAEQMLLISGTGDVIEPDEPVAAVGSGAGYALAAARVLLKHTSLDAETIARESLNAAAAICVYTNEQLTVEVL
jgi:ATP-dependent HslUV protease subunit HslV